MRNQPENILKIFQKYYTLYITRGFINKQRFVKGLLTVTVNNNSPIQDYVHPDDQTEPTFETMFYYLH